MQLRSRIEAVIAQATGEPAKIVHAEVVTGGLINQAQIVTLGDRRLFFVKSNPQSKRYPNLFLREFEALQRLREVGEIRLPEPIACDEAFIVLEAFRSASPCEDWQIQMGRALAHLHLASQRDHYGFDQDNYIGLSAQPNAWQDNWVEFWRTHRLGWQLRLFEAKTDRQDQLLSLGQQLMERLDEIIAEPEEAAVLLHGDLWAGNAAADERGQPIIFDPASYYGRRETEIAMMRMFGGFTSECWAAYSEIWPLADDAERRIACYRLYHELNHLNLFGASYYQRCLATLNSLL